MKVLMLLLFLMAMAIITVAVRHYVSKERIGWIFSRHRKVLSHQSYADAGGANDPLTVQRSSEANGTAQKVEVKARNWISSVTNRHLSNHYLSAAT